MPKPPRQDVIDRVLHHVQSVVPLQPADRRTIEALSRQELGGHDGGYMRRRLWDETPAARTQQLSQALQQGMSLQQAFATAGLPRRSGFRHLAKPAKR